MKKITNYSEIQKKYRKIETYNGLPWSQGRELILSKSGDKLVLGSATLIEKGLVLDFLAERCFSPQFFAISRDSNYDIVIESFDRTLAERCIKYVNEKLKTTPR